MSFENLLPPARYIDVPKGTDLEATFIRLRRQNCLPINFTEAPLPGTGWRIWYQPINVVIGLVG
jgi:hypothetical protein